MHHAIEFLQDSQVLEQLVSSDNTSPILLVLGFNNPRPAIIGVRF
jgi:hypothetical protein